MKFANRVIVSANRKCTWNSREIRTWKRVVLMGKRLKIIYIKILWGGKYNKYIIKFVLWDCFLDIFAVEAYTASWIEIWLSNSHCIRASVEAYTASWIEIFCLNHKQLVLTSKPIRLRGLKSAHYAIMIIETSRSLYGFVDWNLNDVFHGGSISVEAYTASWIEILTKQAAL